MKVDITALVRVAAEDVPTDLHRYCAYQQTCCVIPPFEWAAYSTRLTGRMYTRRATFLGNSLYTAGYLKSTRAPDKEDFKWCH